MWRLFSVWIRKSVQISTRYSVRRNKKLLGFIGGFRGRFVPLTPTMGSLALEWPHLGLLSQYWPPDQLSSNLRILAALLTVRTKHIVAECEKRKIPGVDESGITWSYSRSIDDLIRHFRRWLLSARRRSTSRPQVGNLAFIVLCYCPHSLSVELERTFSGLLWSQRI